MDLDQLKNQFLYFGHRGAPHFAPENTMISFEKAIEMGADAIELDVFITIDKKVIVYHDFYIKKNGKITKIYQMKYNEIKKVNVSGKWKNQFGFQKIPLLDEVMQLVTKNKTLLNIEIKSTGFFPTNIIEHVCNLIKNYNLEKRSIISSFNPLIIRKIKKILPNTFTSLIWSRKNMSFILKWYKPLYYICKPNGIHPDKLYTNEKLIKWAKSKNLLIYVYTINTETELEWQKKLGVNGVFTDNPTIMNYKFQ